MSNDEQNQTDTSEKQHLPLSGLSLLAGDGLLYASARASGKKGIGTALTSAGWGLGGLVALLFGKTPQDRVARIEARNLGQYLKSEGIEIPRTVRDKHPLFQSRGVIDKALQTFYTYPSEFLNGVFALFSVGMIRDGMQSKDKRSLLWGGLAVIAGSLAGLFIKEDPNAPKNAEHGNAIDKAVAYAKEKPLRVSGTLFMINDVFLAKQAAHEYTHFYKPTGGKDKRFLTTVGAVVAYAIGNVFLWFSSRDSARDVNLRPQDHDQIQSLAAEIVAAQPKHLKDKTFDVITKYLTKDRDVTLSPEAIRSNLAQEVSHVQQRRIDAAADRGWRNRHEAHKRAQENKERALT